MSGMTRAGLNDVEDGVKLGLGNQYIYIGYISDEREGSATECIQGTCISSILMKQCLIVEKPGILFTSTNNIEAQ